MKMSVRQFPATYDARETLKKLLDSVGSDFEATYLNRRPATLKLGAEESRSPFSLEAVETYLFSANVASDPDLFRLARDGAEVNGPFDSNDDILRCLASGATLALHGIHRRWLPAARAADAFSERFNAFVAVNAFVTLAEGQAFPLHYDSHDLYILQTDGKKRWRVFRQNHFADDRRIAIDELGPPLIDITLCPGDALYVPRGHYHAVSAADGGSTHIAFGIHPVRVGDLLQQLVGPRCGIPGANDAIDALADSDQTAKLQKVADELKCFFDSDAISEDLQEIIINDLRRSPPLPGNYMATLQAIDSVSQQTKFRRRPGIRLHYMRRTERIFLLTPGGAIPFPLQLESALRCMMELPLFTSTDTAKGLSKEASLLLLKDLAMRGYLEIAKAEC